MSSSSLAYIVAPNVPAGTATLIPNPTKLNGTDPLIDLIPQILVNAENPTGVALGTIPGSTIVYTSANSVSAGTYRVEANFILETTSGSWSSSEAMLLSIATTSNTGVVTSPELSVQPDYFAYFPSATETIFATVSGLLELNASAFPNCLVTRAGAGITTDKTGAIISFTIQKIA
jgi:hypothetical protein